MCCTISNLGLELMRKRAVDGLASLQMLIIYGYQAGGCNIIVIIISNPIQVIGYKLSIFQKTPTITRRIEKLPSDRLDNVSVASQKLCHDNQNYQWKHKTKGLGCLSVHCR